MASMCYHPTVKIVPEKEKEKEKEKEEEESNGSTILATRPETTVEVEMWKEKEEDWWVIDMGFGEVFLYYFKFSGEGI